MRKKLLTLLLAVAASIGTMFAERVQIGDLYYNLYAYSKTAEVTYQKQYFETNYSYLTAINIPESVKYNSVTYSVISIGNYAFNECSGLTSITIPNSVTRIGEKAFYQCTGLKSVTIPNSVTSIGESAFESCSGLTSVTIPNSVTSIGESAFWNCSGLTSVTIPNSVTSIGESAFSGCSGLTSITIPNSVTSIGNSAFYGCKGLTSITIPNSITSIERFAFTGCSGLTSVTIPNSVTSIREWAFAGCTGLKRVTCEAVNPPSLPPLSIEPQIFPTRICNLYVPVNSVKAYKQSSSWREYFKDILPISYYYIAGTMNGWNVGANQMYADDNSFKASIELEANSEYLFKIVCVCGTDTAWYGAGMEATMHYGNSTDWSLYGDANVRLETTQKGNYEFIFVPNEAKNISVIIPAPEEHTYSVVGPLCPDGWDQTSTKCDMTLVDGVYTFRMQNVKLEKDVKYEYKIVQDHSWDVAFPQGGNAEFYVEETNHYNLTFTLNPSTKEYGVKAVLLEKKYFVAGTMNGWNVGANQMYADNNSFKTSIALEANSQYLFKIVCVCGTDTAWYGAGMEATMHYGNSTDWSLYGDANVRLETTQKGNYEFIFVPNEAKKISVIIPAPEEHTYSVVGPLCPDGWDQTSTKCDMTLVDGVYTFRMQNVKLEKDVKYEYKIVKDHSWDGSLPQEGNAEFYVEETNLYNLTFTLNPSTKEYGVTPVPVTVQLAGDLINEWSPEYMTPDKEYRTASITKNLKAGTIKFKVIITGGWLGDSQVFTRDSNTQIVTSNGQDMTLVVDMDGEYVFTWTYATNSLQIIYPEELPIEGIEKVLSPGMVNKLLRDGQIFIIRDGKTFTVQGQEVR